MPTVVALAVFVTYLVAARGPRNLFPLSVFDMYQGHASATAARVLVKDVSGEVAELDDYVDWTCSWEAQPPMSVEATCGSEHRPLDYVLRDQDLYLQAHAGEGDENVRLVSRAYRLSDAGRPRFDDCVLAQCRARRKGGTR